MKKEVRFIPITELRVTKRNDEAPTIEGYAALFNTWSEDLGYFRERIRKGAFKESIKNSDTRALFNHDSNFVLGRKSADTLELSENSVGLRMKITPPDTQWARDLIVSINRNDIDQSSFGFIVEEDEWKEDKKGNVERTITKIAELMDVSLVTFPAYPDTKVAVRRLEEFRSTNADNKEKKPDGENTDSGQDGNQDRNVVNHKTKILKRKVELKQKIIDLEA